jgi:hypothetical protein
VRRLSLRRFHQPSLTSIGAAAPPRSDSLIYAAITHPLPLPLPLLPYRTTQASQAAQGYLASLLKGLDNRMVKERPLPACVNHDNKFLPSKPPNSPTRRVPESGELV